MDELIEFRRSKFIDLIIGNKDGFLICLLFAVFFAFSSAAHAWSPKCALGVTECVEIQGALTPISDGQKMVEACSDLTRNNIGRRALNMSFKKILDVAGTQRSHPLILAHMAYGVLHDSSLKFDRSLPIGQRYHPVKVACRQVFRAMRIPPPYEYE